MPKRFTSTEIWAEDWYLEMPIEYKLFWYYMLSKCDHAGVYKVNLRSFCSLNEVKLGSTSQVLDYFNNGKKRIRVINETTWLVEDFFFYQYGTTFNEKNRVHASIKKEYLKYGIELTSIRGLLDLKHGVKDKDKDKDINNTLKEELTINAIQNEKLLCPKMFKIFKTHLPSYTEDIQRDYEPLASIGQFIFKHNKINGNIFNHVDDVCQIWEKSCVWISTDPFYSQKSLKTISNHIQEIVNKTNNGTNANKTAATSTGREIKFDKP